MDKTILKGKTRGWLIDNVIGLVEDNNKLESKVSARDREILMLVSMLEDALSECD